MILIMLVLLLCAGIWFAIYNLRPKDRILYFSGPRQTDEEAKEYSNWIDDHIQKHPFGTVAGIYPKQAKSAIEALLYKKLTISYDLGYISKEEYEEGILNLTENIKINHLLK